MYVCVYLYVPMSLHTEHSFAHLETYLITNTGASRYVRRTSLRQNRCINVFQCERHGLTKVPYV